MVDRKWENLPLDCLVDIFSKVGLVSLVEGVPYVCKSWYKATLSPQCWQSLFFPRIKENSLRAYPDLVIRRSYADWVIRRCCYTKSFVKFVISRSQGSAYSVAFSTDFPMTQEVFNCIVEGCPSLKRLELPPSFSAYVEIEGYAISTLLPNIEFLSLRGSSVTRSVVVNILKGCKKLVHFDAGSWRGFDVDDKIMNLAAHITTFKFEDRKTEYINDLDYGSDDYYSD